MEPERKQAWLLQIPSKYRDQLQAMNKFAVLQKLLL